jgi:hypothetical protein
MLVLADGEQLMLHGEGSAALFGYSLSPDGRWLASVGTTGTTVRDLTGDRVHLVEPPETADGLAPWAWSADSRWLLLAESDLDSDLIVQPTAVLFDLTEGTSTRVTAPGGRMFAAVLPSGEVVAVDDPLGFGNVAGRRTRVEVEVLEPVSANASREFVIDAGEWLETSESLAQEGSINGVQLVTAPGGDRLFLSVFGDATGPTALLEADLDGRILSRVEIAAEMPVRRIWWLAGQLEGQVIVALTQFIPGGTERSLTLFAVSGDGLREMTVLEPALFMRLAGTAAQGGAPY